MSNESFKLAAARPGTFVCSGVDEGSENPVRMKSLGICKGRQLEIVSGGDPMIIRGSGSRVGLSRTLASSVFVTKSER